MEIVKKLWWFFKLEKKAYLIAIFSLILTSIINLIPPKIIGNVVDKVSSSYLSNSELILNIIVIILSAFIMYFLRYTWRLNLFGASYKLAKIMRYKLYTQFTKMSPSFYQKYRTGDLMARATNDVDALNQMAGPGVMSAVDATITAFATLCTMFFILSWKLTLIVIIPLPFIAFATSKVGRKIHTKFKESQQAFSDLNNNVQESIAGIKVTKSFDYGEDEIKKFEKTNEKNYLKNMQRVKYDVLFDPIIIVFVGFCYLLSLIFGSYLIYNNEFTVGELIAFVAYLDMLIWPLLAMGFLFNLLQRGSASYERIEKLLSESSDIKEINNPILDCQNGDIEFNINTFSYDGVETIRDVNFYLKKGQTLGIVGATGSGKTTLLKLLLRERDAHDGEIKIAGHNIKNYKLKDLRKLIGYTPQDQILFSTTIKENIKFASNNFSDEEVINATKISNIYQDIIDMPDKFETLVGERGVSLSGGQKQRIAISRAIIKNPEILILDDSLSAVDAKTEDLILNNLKQLRVGKTTIITSHRMSAVVHADLIIVMENGTILEKGIHNELMKNKNWYYETYTKQQIESNI